MLVTLKKILKDAREKKYAVGAFNLLNMESIRGAIEAAEELQSPIILQLTEFQMQDSPMELIFPMMLSAAKNTDIPVCVHFDHGYSLENIIRALEFGCSSVMFDGASLPFEENITRTREVIRYAHSFGASCEAEIGIVGGAEAGHYSFNDDNLITKLSEAHDFAKKTKCDALAVAIGNAHGAYIKEPRLRFDRLEEIFYKVKTPLVLHGGSGISVEDFRRCISLGITKINVATALQVNMSGDIGELYKNGNIPDFPALTNTMKDAVKRGVMEHIQIFGSEYKANSVIDFEDDEFDSDEEFFE